MKFSDLYNNDDINEKTDLIIIIKINWCNITLWWLYNHGNICTYTNNHNIHIYICLYDCIHKYTCSVLLKRQSIGVTTQSIHIYKRQSIATYIWITEEGWYEKDFFFFHFHFQFHFFQRIYFSHCSNFCLVIHDTIH
jgi:hypothetical protein